MHKYIESVFNEFIPENKGYTYIGTESLFVPIYRTTLTITKRKQTRLNLVEEMVLRIVNCGVTDLDEIAGILGLSRDVLDITIGDLYIKSFAYPSSNKCYLMADGRNVLKNLLASKKERDTIRNIYVNALNQDVISGDLNNLVDKSLEDDLKLRHTFDGKDIDFYRNRVGIIKEVFNKENEMYSLDSKYVPDELISIDEVEDINVCFLRIPTHIYISQTGTDLDLISADKRMSELLDAIKGEILEQIRKRKVLKRVFTRYPVQEVPVPSGIFGVMDELKMLLNKYVTDKSKQAQYYGQITSKIYSDRELIDNELDKLFELSLQEVNKVTFYIDSLDYWSKNSKFLTLLTLIPRKVKFVIIYNHAGNSVCYKKH